MNTLAFQPLVIGGLPLIDPFSHAMSPVARKVTHAGTSTAISETAQRDYTIDPGVFDAVLTAGNDAQISWATFETANAFMSALPSSLGRPEISVEPDGEMAFDWQENPRRTLSINVGDGEIGFAALIGTEAIYGRVPFVSTLPDTVALLLRKVVQR